MSQPAGSRVGYGETVFRSVGWPVTRWFLVRAWAVYVLPAVVIGLLMDSSFWRDPLVLGFVLLFPMIGPVMIATGWPRGHFYATQEGIVLKVAFRTVRYSWGDIASLRLTSWSEAGPRALALCRVFGFDLRKEFLEMKLRTSIRFNPVSGSMSTRGFGEPTHLRKVSLCLDDPRAFLAAAEVHLQPGIHA